MKPHGILFNGADVRAILDGRKTQTRRVLKPKWGSGTCTCDQPQWTSKVPDDWHCETCGAGIMGALGKFRGLARPYGVAGDRLWVREAWALVPRTAYAMSEGVQQTLRPDDPHDAAVYAEGWERSKPGRWRPSIHMPQWAARIWLEVTEIRCQRLQDISEADARAEGVSVCRMDVIDAFLESDEPARLAFRDLWESIYLPPAPVYGEGRRIVSYVSYPWAEADFAAAYPEAAASQTWKGKPLTITSNPWVWAYTFKRIEKP